MPYNLGFITDEAIFNHVKHTIEKYRSIIRLKEFQKNIIDPIKLTFDAKIYRQSWEEIIEVEVIRQLDKSNNNHIGYFHQNIFQYIDGWQVPKHGFDVVNSEKQIFVEMKNKHNTMNASSSQKTYMNMQAKLLENPEATCMLVEVIAKRSQNIPWQISLNSNSHVHDNIRRVSIDKFYEIATGQADAFYQLCRVLPKVMDDVLAQTDLDNIIQNTVLAELLADSPTEAKDDILKRIFKTSFATYQGFENFSWSELC